MVDLNSGAKKILSDRECSILRRLGVADMSFVFEKLALDGRIRTDKIPPLEREFKKFMALAGFGIHPLAMISPLIDEVWHQFILFTDRYRDFCFKTIGHFVGHQPDIKSMPIPIAAGENFRSQYRRYFGSLPEIWFEGMSPRTRDYYLAPALVGRPPMAWSGWTGPPNDDFASHNEFLDDLE